MLLSTTLGCEMSFRFAAILFCASEVIASARIEDQYRDLLSRKSTRERRSLVYLTSPLLQLSIAFTMPYNLPKRPMQISYGFQLNYQLPTNISQIEPFPRKRRDVVSSMASSFLELESLLEERGFAGSGRECLLRSICELARSPLERGQGGEHVDDAGMMEQVLHALLTPSADVASMDRYATRPHDHDVHQEFRYLHAEQIGQSGSECHLAFPSCHQSPLEMITELI